MADNYSIKVQAKVDMPSNKDIDAQIRKLEKSISKLKVSGQFDDTALRNLTNQLNSLKATISTANFSPTALSDLTNQVNRALQNINIGNINVGGIGNQAQQVGQQIGQQFNQGFNSAIQKGNLQKDFHFLVNEKNNVAKQAQQYFRGLSNGIVTVNEEMENFEGNSELSAFTINIKNAQGEIESLRYSLKNITDDNGNVTGQMFGYTGGSINDINVVKEFAKHQKIVTDFEIKLKNLQATYTKANVDYSPFTTVFDNFKQGIGNVNDLRKALNQVESDAKKITQGLKSQSASFDPIQQALNNMRDMPSMLKTLEANMKGVSDKTSIAGISVSDFTKEYNKLQTEMSDGKVPLTEQWVKDYQELMSAVTSATKQVEALKKAESAKVDTPIFKIDDLKKDDIAYMSKVYNTIEKQQTEINRMAKAKGWNIIDVSGIEEADGKIKKLTLTVRDAEGTLKKFDMQREKLQGKGKAQYGLMQVGNVKVLETASKKARKEQEDLIDAMAKGREQAELSRQAEEERQQIVQSNAINKALEEEYKQRQKNIETTRKQSELEQQKAHEIQLSMSGEGKNNYALQISKITEEYKKLGLSEEQLNKLETGIRELNTAHKNLADTIAKDISEYDSLKAKNKAIIEADEKRTIILNKVNNEYQEMRLTVPKLVTDLSRLNKVESMQKWADNNSNAMKRFGSQIDEIIRQMGNLENSMNKVEFDKLIKEYKSIQEEARNLGLLGRTNWDKFTNAFEQIGGWSFAAEVLSKSVDGIREVYNEALNLDNAITDLTMATNASASEIESLVNSYSNLGEKLNATITDVIESGTEWLKQGQSITDTETLITNAMMLSKIGKLSSAEATQYLTSAMKGYQITAQDTLSIVDKLSAVDMASATDVDGLAEGMSKVASSAELAGVSMDKLLGYLATVGEVTQDGMSEIGTTFNAIFSRMGNIKLSRLTDFETGEDLSNVETVLRGVGISLRDSLNSFRDFDEVLDETASRWHSFSDTQQRAIASAFSGTEHLNEFIILMENYGNALKYTETSMNSSGEAMEKFKSYQKSVVAHTELFKKSLQDVANAAVDTGLVNNVIDLGTTGLKILKELVTYVDPLTIGFTALIGVLNKGKLK